MILKSASPSPRLVPGNSEWVGCSAGWKVRMGTFGGGALRCVFLICKLICSPGALA
jgi:hypothetical protein